MAWPTICRPKILGGIGIKRLRQMNRAMLAKLLWRVILEENVLWVKVLRAKYGNPLSGEVSRKACIHMWRSMLTALPMVLDSLVHYEDQDGMEAQEAANLKWKEASNGIFTMVSAYRKQVGAIEQGDSRAWRNVWKLKGPQRANFLLWQARLDRLPTKSLFYQRHLSESPICDLYMQGADTGLHALRKCTWSWRIWNSLVTNVYAQNRFIDEGDICKWIDGNLVPNGVGGQRRDIWPYLS